jgi:type II secretory pathway component PulF
MIKLLNRLARLLASAYSLEASLNIRRQEMQNKLPEALLYQHRKDTWH